MAECKHGILLDSCIWCLREEVSRLKLEVFRLKRGDFTPEEIAKLSGKSVVQQEREACIAIVRQYLLYDSQRAVSWHEVQDVIDVINKRGN